MTDVSGWRRVTGKEDIYMLVALLGVPIPPHSISADSGYEPQGVNVCKSMTFWYNSF